jgi:hypothetical protein
MSVEQQLVFGTFRLDARSQQLWRGEEAVEIQARPLAVLQYGVEARRFADELKHPASQAFAGHYTALVHIFRREYAAAQAAAEAQIALTQEQGFHFWLAMAEMVLGGALAGQGQAQRGVTLIQAGLRHMQATGARISRSLRKEESYNMSDNS